MMFMNIAATNTALTTTFWLTERTGSENFTNSRRAWKSRLFQGDGPRYGSHADGLLATAFGDRGLLVSFRLRGPIVASRRRAMIIQMMPSRSIAPMPVSQWAASCVHRASGFWPLGPWLIDDWMTFRLIVDATAPRPQRAGAIRATSPSVPVSGNRPPDSATWTMVTPTRIGMVWSPLVTSVEIARPISMDVTDSTASATKISISAVPGITTPLDGTFCPARPTSVTSADCITAIRLSTMTFEKR